MWFFLIVIFNNFSFRVFQAEEIRVMQQGRKWRRLQWVEFLLHPLAVLAFPPTLALHQVLGEVSGSILFFIFQQPPLASVYLLSLSLSSAETLILTHLSFQATPWVSWEISPSSRWCDNWSSRTLPCFLPCCRRSAGKTPSCCRWSTERALCILSDNIVAVGVDVLGALDTVLI